MIDWLPYVRACWLAGIGLGELLEKTTIDFYKDQAWNAYGTMGWTEFIRRKPLRDRHPLR